MTFEPTGLISRPKVWESRGGVTTWRVPASAVEYPAMSRKSTIGSNYAPELEALGVWLSVLGIAVVLAIIGAGLFRFVEVVL